MQRASSSTKALWAIVAVTLMVGAPALTWASTVVVHSPGGSASIGTASAAVAATSAVSGKGQALLAAASSSLATGAGPAAGTSWRCSAPNGGSFDCSIPHALAPVAGGSTVRSDSSARPSPVVSAATGPTVASSSPDPTWYNQSNYMAGPTGSPDVYDAAAAYDPEFNEVVLFGGCSFVCPTNATWIYSGDGWQNITSELGGSVPAEFGGSMIWEPAWDAVVLVGGFNASGVGMNWTWAFYGSYWYNWTSYLGPAATYTGVASGTGFAALGYDDALGEAVLVDGCVSDSCLEVWNQYWVLNDSGWFDIGSGPTSGGYWNFNWGQSIAYDPVSQELVLFGGASYYGGVINGTYVFDGSGWTNITSSSSSSICLGLICLFYYPSGRDFASMTWDGQLNEIILTSGANETTFFNDTWYFAGGKWSLSDVFLSYPGPIPVYEAAMPANSTGIAPLLVGGIGTSAYCFEYSWVFENPAQIAFYEVSPNPTDTNLSSYVQVNVAKGTGSGPDLWFDLWDSYEDSYSGEMTGVTFSLTWAFAADFGLTNYPAPYNDTLYAQVFDFFGVPSALTTSYLNVNKTVEAAPVASPSLTEVGVPVTFSSGAADGVGPYSYLWSFGDGVKATSAAPTHTYASHGTYDGWVNVTDSVGAFVNKSFSVTVNASLTANVQATPNPPELGASTTFSALIGNGVGVPPFTYAWNFGDGVKSTLASPTHTYASSRTYDGWVVITDHLGVSVNESFSITVYPKLTATVAASTTSPHTGDTVTFTATAQGGTGHYTVYSWQFGDGTASLVGPSVDHSYSNAGTYEVNVTITDTASYSVTEHLNVTVSKPPTLLTELTSGTGLYVLTGVIVVILAVIAALLLVRHARKGRKPSEAPAPPAPSTPPGGTGGTGGTPPTTGTGPGGT